MTTVSITKPTGGEAGTVELPAELHDPLECGREVGHVEIGERHRVPGAPASRVDSEFCPTRVRLAPDALPVHP